MLASWRSTWSGWPKASYTVHSGQVPPVRLKWKCVADWRLEILPARSTRTKKKGTPGAPGRCSVLRRWQTVSKPTPKRWPSRSMS